MKRNSEGAAADSHEAGGEAVGDADGDGADWMGVCERMLWDWVVIRIEVIGNFCAWVRWSKESFDIDVDNVEKES